MQFIDSHIHLQDYKNENVQEIIKNMKDIGFKKIICASSYPDDWQNIAEIVQIDQDFVIPAFGVHPWYLCNARTDWYKTLDIFLSKYKNALVGECGIDNLKSKNKLQENFFLRQIELAKTFNRAICIHSLKAENQMEKLLSEMPDKFMFHGFGGSIEFLKKILRHDGYISISNSLTKKKRHIEIIENIPCEKMLIESDAPYMSEYNKIADFITYIAKIKKIDKITLTEQIYQNFEEFCRV